MSISVAVTMVVCAVLLVGGGAWLSLTLTRRRARPSTAFSGAGLAQGTIVDRRDTHRALNYAYGWVLTLDVATPDGRRFTAEARVRILAGFQQSVLLPGTVVPVRWRPDVPGVVEVAFDQLPGAGGSGRTAWADTR